jgi:hypothetical protein
VPSTNKFVFAVKIKGLWLGLVVYGGRRKSWYMRDENWMKKKLGLRED